MVPSQFHSEQGTRAGLDGQQLRAAVLICAVRDATGRPVISNTARRPCLDARLTSRIQRDALAWFASDDTSWPYSFLNICEALGLHPRTLRDRLPTLTHVATRAGYRNPIKGLTVRKPPKPRRKSA